jgi:1-deoxy-D-xylulose-5-phosphate reductoisomerase
MRKIAILGSTGSIGQQALTVAGLHPDEFQVSALTAHNNSELLFAQVRVFRPLMAGLTGGEVAIPEDLRFCSWVFGEEALAIACAVPCDDVLVSVVGVAGLSCVLMARKAGKRVLLANKEALVAGGALAMAACSTDYGAPTLIPVDSEHSAIYQCLRGERENPFEEIILTASGGPFRTWNINDMLRATPQQALAHPNWNMGAKITIDSATMFNKALEIIEARWLFGAAPEQIKVLIHPQSIIHSMVRFADGAVLAQLGVPDMRVPILYAMGYPARMPTGIAPLDFTKYAQLTFEEPDLKRFPAIGIAYNALRAGGAACCMLNAANEVAVESYLKQSITFGMIYPVVAETLSKAGHLPAETIEQVRHADQSARGIARDIINRQSSR